MRTQRKWIYAALLSICMALFLITVPASAAEKEVPTYGELMAALADTNISMIKLKADINIDDTLTVNRPVTLDLNGFVLQMTDQKSVIKVESSGDLTIQDSDPSKSHRFTPNSDGLWVLDETNGTETVSGGVITGGVASENTGTAQFPCYCGGGVYIAEGGKLTMTGGNIVGCTSVEDYGGGVYVTNGTLTLTMTGGNIVGCTAMSGGGIFCNWNGNMIAKIEMSGTALVRDCRAKEDGGGIWIYGELSMENNAAIRGCTARHGGGVNVNSSSKLSMSDNAVIEGCKAVGDGEDYYAAQGGGIRMSNNASLTMSGNASVMDCSAERSNGSPSSYGGGVSTDTVKEIILDGDARIDQGSAPNQIGLYITGSAWSGYGNLYANGGSVNGDVILGDDKDCPCTITRTGSGRTAFNGTVTVHPGSTIKDGTFNGTVNNNGTITGGMFDTIINGESGTVAEGVSAAHLQFTVTFDNNGVKTTESIDKGSTLTAPTAPTTKEGYLFDGWYYNNNGTQTKWDFDKDTVHRAMTLTAQWKKAYTVTVENDGNGSASAAPASAAKGEEITLTATPNSGYHLKEWQTVSGGVTISNNRFTMPADNVTVKAIFEKKSGGGASSSGGGSSGSAAPTVSTTIPVSGEAVTIRITVTINGTTATISEIDPAELKKVIGTTGIVKIDLSGLNMDIDRVNLPTNSIKVIVNAAEHAHNDAVSLAVVFRHGTVTLDNKTMRAVINQTKGSLIRLVLDDAGTAQLNHTQKTAIAGLNVHGGMEVYLLCVTGNKRISDFEGGVATLSIPFPVPAGHQASAFHALYVSDAGDMEWLATRYADGKLHWDVGHFSDFVIVYDENKANPDTASDRSTKKNLLTIARTAARIAAAYSSLMKKPHLILPGWY